MAHLVQNSEGRGGGYGEVDLWVQWKAWSTQWAPGQSGQHYETVSEGALINPD